MGGQTVWNDPYELENKKGAKHLSVIRESQALVDLVIVMLGINDLKSHFNQNAFSIADSCGRLGNAVAAQVNDIFS